MSQFGAWLITRTRFFLAEFFVQIFAFIVFCIAGIAWLYFSTIYAAMPVIIVGIALGTYLYGLIEGEKRKAAKRIKIAA